MKRRLLIVAGLWMGVSGAALALGAADLDWSAMLELRLARVLLASVVGVALTIAGVSLQALFTNPLCEPYTLGVSSGAAFGAVIGVSWGMAWNVYGLAGTAFIGAAFFSLLLYGIAFKGGGWGGETILLGGVMLGFVGSSLVSVWMALSDPSGLQGALSWLLGDLSRARMEGVAFSALAVLGLSLLLWIRWREFDALLLGEEEARALGVDVDRTRSQVILITSLLTGVAVSAAGMIGFVGLVVPHLTRRWIGAMHFSLIPVAAFVGACTVVLADLLARTMISPHELPVGVVTALVGAPFFIWMLLRRRERR